MCAKESIPKNSIYTFDDSDPSNSCLNKKSTTKAKVRRKRNLKLKQNKSILGKSRYGRLNTTYAHVSLQKNNQALASALQSSKQEIKTLNDLVLFLQSQNHELLLKLNNYCSEKGQTEDLNKLARLFSTIQENTNSCKRQFTKYLRDIQQQMNNIDESISAFDKALGRTVTSAQKNDTIIENILKEQDLLIGDLTVLDENKKDFVNTTYIIGDIQNHESIMLDNVPLKADPFSLVHQQNKKLRYSNLGQAYIDIEHKPSVTSISANSNNLETAQNHKEQSPKVRFEEANISCDKQVMSLVDTLNTEKNISILPPLNFQIRNKNVGKRILTKQPSSSTSNNNAIGFQAEHLPNDSIAISRKIKSTVPPEPQNKDIINVKEASYPIELKENQNAQIPNLLSNKPNNRKIGRRSELFDPSSVMRYKRILKEPEPSPQENDVPVDEEAESPLDISLLRPNENSLRQSLGGPNVQFPRQTVKKVMPPTLNNDSSFSLCEIEDPNDESYRPFGSSQRSKKPNRKSSVTTTTATKKRCSTVNSSKITHRNTENKNVKRSTNINTTKNLKPYDDQQNRPNVFETTFGKEVYEFEDIATQILIGIPPKSNIIDNNDTKPTTASINVKEETLKNVKLLTKATNANKENVPAAKKRIAKAKGTTKSAKSRQDNT